MTGTGRWRPRAFRRIITWHVLACWTLVGAQVDPGRLERLDRYIAASRLAQTIPGVAVGVVQGTNVVFGQGYGEGISPRTPFKIGSLSKSFTAIAIMQLVEQGKLDLDSPVRHYLPWFRTADSKESDRITVRHLLHHRGGISDRGAGFKPDRTYARELGNLMQSSPRMRVKFPPGSRFAYSNIGYEFLGAVVTAVSGVPLPDYVRANIFEPLQMRHSHTSVAEAQRAGLVGHRYLFGSPVRFDSVRHHPPIAAGGLISCAEDLGRYVGALMNGGMLDGRRVLSAAGTERLFAPYEEKGQSNYYAKAWMLRTEGTPPVRVIQHGGAVTEFLAAIAFRPDQQLGLILLVNANSDAKPGLHQFVQSAPTRFLLDQPPPTWRELHPMYYMTVGAKSLVALLPFVQGAGVVATVRRLRRWHAGQVATPTRRVWLLRWWLPLTGHGFVALLLFWLLPEAFDMTLTGLIKAVPDWGTLTAVVGGFALVWGTIRSVLVGKALRQLALQTKLGERAHSPSPG